jgi:hypothetical protein
MYKDAAALDRAVKSYFKACKPTKVLDADGNQVMDKGFPLWEQKPPTITGLSLHLGFKDRYSFYEYMKRGDDFATILTRAKTMIEEFHERALSGKDRCTGSIFFLKNHGWIDEQFLSGGSAPIGVASMALTAEEEASYKANMAAFFQHVKP